MVRLANDKYNTCYVLVQELLQKVEIQGSVFEPCAGDGDIATQFSRCFTNDIDVNLRKKDGSEHDYYLDVTKAQAWQQLRYFNSIDWVVTNPPYKNAFDILRHSWNHCNVGIAFLLRLSFLEPTKERGAWLEMNADNLCKFIPVNPRPKFRTDTNGTDSITNAWFVWRKDFSWERAGFGCPFEFIRDWR